MLQGSVMHALWRQNRVIPIILILLLLGILGIYLMNAHVLAPEAEQLQREYLDQKAELRQMEQLGTKKDTPEAIYRQGKKDLAAFFEAIPPREDLTRLIDELFALARNAGLAIDRIGYDPQKLEDTPLLSYTLMFSVTGNYAQLKEFIFSLEQSERIIALDEISFAAGDAAMETVSLNLRFTTYFKAGQA